MTARAELLAHLQTGCTTVCRAWAVLRRDGVSYGFTDHDAGFAFDGIAFKASSGMSAKALQQSTGLSVDNTETIGALSDAAVDEADILAGRFDAAEVRVWLVNWNDPTQRIEQFRGNFGEITRAGGAFKAELRGLTDRLNQPQGQVFQRACSAVLGDAACGVDLTLPAYSATGTVSGFDTDRRIFVTGLAGFAAGWFERGRFKVQSGAAKDLGAVVKFDRIIGTDRVIELWTQLAPGLAVGDAVFLTAGCDKQMETCKVRFSNFLNYHGFPHIPGEDWLTSYPVRSRANDGGSLGR